MDTYSHLYPNKQVEVAKQLDYSSRALAMYRRRDQPVCILRMQARRCSSLCVAEA